MQRIVSEVAKNIISKFEDAIMFCTDFVDVRRAITGFARTKACHTALMGEMALISNGSHAPMANVMSTLATKHFLV